MNIQHLQRPFALIRTHDQWMRASHENTALLGEVVGLTWQKDSADRQENREPFKESGAGLAFDEHCRLFHSVPSEGRVERLLWAVEDSRSATDQPESLNLFDTGNELELGDFSPSGPPPAQLDHPRALAVDCDGRLFVAEAGAKRILIYDLWAKRLLRRIPLGAVPLDFVADGRTVYALVAAPAGLLQLEAHTGPEPLKWPAEITKPSRLALSPSHKLYILEKAGTESARILRYDPRGTAEEVIAVKFATDIEFQFGEEGLMDMCSHEVFVVARRPDEDFLRFCVGNKKDEVSDLPPLKGRNYDGSGIVLVPDGRIGFWTRTGFRHSVPARLRYLLQGSVTTFRLDSGEFQTVWGRLFLDACIPRETQITVRCLAADEPPEDPETPRQPPANVETEEQTETYRTASPPMPPQSFYDRLKTQRAQSLHRRESGREIPWCRPEEDDPFETYEAPIITEPGRYLWVRFELTGNTRTSPRFRALRAEYPSHDYLRRIPKTFSRQESEAAFLRRYLAIFEGMLGELEARADARGALLDPRSAPVEILPWLAGFLGLAFDERMAHAPRPGGVLEDVRRTLIQEAMCLFRFRGTVRGLRRFLEIYLGVKPILIEKFRLRGLGGALLGDTAGLMSSSVLGAGFRIGGAIGESETQVLTGTLKDAFATHAHRFTVIIPSVLTEEQLAVVQQILEVHRPAHTLVDVCTVGAGMRVGRGLHVELTSIVGPSGGFQTLRAGGSFLGRGAIVGRPAGGTRPGASRLAEDSRVG